MKGLLGPNDFDSNFKNFDRRFNFMWRFVWVFFFVVLLISIAWYSLIGYVAVQAVDQVGQHGLKGVVERVWEGPKNEHSEGSNAQR